MDSILIILKKENGPRASSAPALGLNTIIFKHVYWYMQQTQVSVYRTIGPLVLWYVANVFQKGFGIIKQLLPMSEGDMTICSTLTGNIHLPLVNKSSCHPHSGATIV